MHESTTVTSRRSFLEKIFTMTVVAVAAPTVVLGRIVPRLYESNGVMSGRYRIDLTDPTYAALAQVGGSMRLARITGVSFRVIVTRTGESTFAAVNATCTHLGNLVNAATSTSNGLLVCPAHGSKFNPDGSLVAGPATRPLQGLPTFFDGGSILEIEIAGIAAAPEEIAAGAAIGTPVVDRDGARVSATVVLEHGAHVRAEVYSAAGERVALLLDGALAAGEHEVTGSLAGVPGGAYFLRFEADGRSISSRRFLVAR